MWKIKNLANQLKNVVKRYIGDAELQFEGGKWKEKT